MPRIGSLTLPRIWRVFIGSLFFFFAYFPFPIFWCSPITATLVNPHIFSLAVATPKGRVVGAAHSQILWSTRGQLMGFEPGQKTGLEPGYHLYIYMFNLNLSRFIIKNNNSNYFILSFI